MSATTALKASVTAEPRPVSTDRPALHLVPPATDTGRKSIGRAYADLPSAFPATAMVGAIFATVALFVTVGTLALPAAAFA